MHEISVARQIAEAVLRAVRKEKAVNVDRINLEIGEFTFLNPEQIIFWLTELFKNTEAEGAEIIHKMLPVKVRCSKCGYEGALTVTEDPLLHLNLPVFACPGCQKGSLEILEGRDCIVRSIEILTEEDVSSPDNSQQK